MLALPTVTWTCTQEMDQGYDVLKEELAQNRGQIQTERTDKNTVDLLAWMRAIHEWHGNGCVGAEPKRPSAMSMNTNNQKTLGRLVSDPIRKTFTADRLMKMAVKCGNYPLIINETVDPSSKIKESPADDRVIEIKAKNQELTSWFQEEDLPIPFACPLLWECNQRPEAGEQQEEEYRCQSTGQSLRRLARCDMLSLICVLWSSCTMQVKYGAGQDLARSLTHGSSRK